MGKTLGQMLREAREAWELQYTETGKYDPDWRVSCDEAAASAVRKAVLTEAIEAAKQKVEALNNRVLSTDDDGLAGYYDDMADGAREVVAALQRLIGETSIGVMPPAEQAEQSVSPDKPALQTGFAWLRRFHHASMPYQEWRPFDDNKMVEVSGAHGESRIARAGDLWWGYEEECGEIGEGVILYARLAQPTNNRETE